MANEKSMLHTLYATCDPTVDTYTRPDGGEYYHPFEYTGWMDETLSWKKSCYIHTFLSGGITSLEVSGPEAVKLMDETFVNNFNRFPVGSCKHIISCAPTGNITSHGICLRVAEDKFETYGLDPIIPMKIQSGKYNVKQYTPEYFKDYVFQIAGPRSLELVENVIQEDIHDLKFMRFRPAKVKGHNVRVLRMGMGGTLSYEFHGSVQDAMDVYEEIIRIGKQFDLKRLGFLSYMSNHTENGFPQWGNHFAAAWEEDPEIMEYMRMNDAGDAERMTSTTGVATLHGSLNDQGLSAYYVNPIEVGWGKMIDWNSDFQGKEALRKIADDPKTRKIVTLEWNTEDILKVFAAYFDEDERVPEQMMFPQNSAYVRAGNNADKVVDNEGNMIGKSAGFLYTLYYKRVISQAELLPEYAEIGKEVTVIWGPAGSRQMPIRAKVARYPYLDLTANVDYDIESVPHYKA